MYIFALLKLIHFQVVEQHQDIVNFREQQKKDEEAVEEEELVQEEKITTTTISSKELINEEDDEEESIDEYDENEEDQVEDGSEQLSELQRDVLINLELISELVKQVHQLDIIFADRNREEVLDNNSVDDYEEEEDNTEK